MTAGRANKSRGSLDGPTAAWIEHMPSYITKVSQTTKVRAWRRTTSREKWKSYEAAKANISEHATGSRDYILRIRAFCRGAGL